MIETDWNIVAALALLCTIVWALAGDVFNRGKGFALLIALGAMFGLCFWVVAAGYFAVKVLIT